MEKKYGSIVLASASPRRREILERVGFKFEVCPAKGEEETKKTDPKEVVMELSTQKAREVAGMIKQFGLCHDTVVTPQNTLVIGADTVVAAEDGTILGKPRDEEDAFRMLSVLSGKMHRVFTGVTFVMLEASGKAYEYSFYEETRVFMRALSEQMIRRYIATGEPMDKAGAYGIQGKCAIFIERIEGDYNNVVGLPVARIYSEMERLGIEVEMC